MTAARPPARFNITRKSTRKRLTQGPCRKVSVAAATDVITDVSEQSKQDTTVDAGFCEEPFADNGELLSSLSPLLSSMKLFGLYFHRQDRRRRPTDDLEWNSCTITATAGIPSTRLRVYATIILLFVWLNTIRFASVFTRSDRFGAILFMKITMFTYCVLMAIFQTTYYYANHTGQLLKILTTLPVTRDCVRGTRRAAIVLTVFSWINMIADLAAGAYIFLNSDEEYNFILAPFVTYIYVPKYNIEVAKIVGFLGYILFFSGTFFAQSMNELLVYIFYSQFKTLKKNFRLSLGEGGRFNGDLSWFRRRHK